MTPPAAPTHLVLTEEVARDMSAAQLCYGVSMFRPANAQTAAAEVKRRGINCQEHAGAVQEMLRTQALQAAPQPLPETPDIQPMQAPRSIYCTTLPSMGGLQTTCR